ncbi:hypothetical protein AMTRI_Chr13g87810 [Amborella trichopoda]
MVLYISVYINPSLCISVSVCLVCMCVKASENSLHICIKEARVCVLKKSYLIKSQTTSKALENSLHICMKEARVCVLRKLINKKANHK